MRKAVTPKRQMSIRLSIMTDAQIDEMAMAFGESRSAIVARAVEEYYRRQAKKAPVKTEGE